MRHATYLIILTACLVGTLPLEFALRTRVFARWRRLLVVLVPVVVVFAGWDALAIGARWWHYDCAQIVNVDLPGRLPVEELLFFVVVPTCAVLTLEAVRACKPQWTIGDEPQPERQSGPRLGS